jgi:hypothetical protein
MAHIDLDSADMKPAALVRFEIAQQASHAKQLLVAAVIASAMIVVLAGMFVTAVP